MDVFALAEQGWWFTVPIAALVGIILGASPLGWPSAVTSLSVAAAADPDGRPSTRSLLLIGAGITAVYGALGLAVDVLDDVLRRGFGAWAGPMYAALAVAVLGIGIALLFRPSVVCSLRVGRPRRGGATGIALGVFLGSVSCPACAGIITGVALAGAAAGGTTVAFLAMLALGAGQTISLLVLGRVVGTWRDLAVSPLLIQRLSGATLALTGVFFAWQAFGNGLDVATTLP